jgi:hypothetical protein
VLAHPYLRLILRERIGPLRTGLVVVVDIVSTKLVFVAKHTPIVRNRQCAEETKRW